MVSFTLSTALALLATTTSTMAMPAPVFGDCTAWYTPIKDDTCGTIVDKFQNMTAPDLVQWNPYITNTCFGIHEDYPMCIGVQGYVYPGPILSGAVFSDSQNPAPVQSQSIVANCNKFEYTGEDAVPYWTKLLSDNGINAMQWTAWNYPAQNTTATSQWAGYFSCVGTK